ncbi:unnamed protein product [Closterium sp. NIES-64]|nr:unnamed protein product [Closterium sp. NIES-64]
MHWDCGGMRCTGMQRLPPQQQHAAEEGGLQSARTATLLHSSYQHTPFSSDTTPTFPPPPFLFLPPHPSRPHARTPTPSPSFAFSPALATCPTPLASAPSPMFSSPLSPLSTSPGPTTLAVIPAGAASGEVAVAREGTRFETSQNEVAVAREGTLKARLLAGQGGGLAGRGE